MLVIALSLVKFYIFNTFGAVIENHSMLTIISSIKNIFLAWATPGIFLYFWPWQHPVYSSRAGQGRAGQGRGGQGRVLQELSSKKSMLSVAVAFIRCSVLNLN